MKRKRTWIVILVLAGAAYAGHRWYPRKDAAPAMRETAAERGDLEVTILATGVVQPRNRLEIKPPIAGRLDDILVREGDAVKKGQVLAWMSSNERAALLDAARAKGPKELAHWEELYKPAPLIAPLDGVVIDRKVEPGQTATAQDILFVMSDRLVVKAQVDETDIGRVKPGQETALTLDAFPDRPVDGKVEHIAFEATTVNNVTIYEVDVLPAEVPEFMRSGMTANVTFVVERKEDVLLVPADAVQQREGRSTVRVPGPDGGGPAAREVETGLTDGRRVEVVSGLREGDKVLVQSMRLPASSSRGSSPFAPGGAGRRQSQSGGQGVGGRR
jgi:membrane fusion protein, macrolide-specific efflux system